MPATRMTEWPVINSANGFVLFAVRGGTLVLGERDEQRRRDRFESAGLRTRPPLFKIIVDGILCRNCAVWRKVGRCNLSCR